MIVSRKFTKIALACVGALAVTGGIVGVSLAVSSANSAALENNEDKIEELSFHDVAIPEGRYYLDGDAESEYWIDVDDNIINVSGPDLEGLCYDWLNDEYSDDEEESHRNAARNSVKDYLHPNEYRAVMMNGVDSICVFINWDECDGYIAGNGFSYNDNTINLAFAGDFVLDGQS